MSRQWKEGLFFCTYFMAAPIMIQIQYGRDPQLADNPFWPAVVYHSITGMLNMIPFYCFYKWVLPRYLFRRRYAGLAFAIVGFAIFFDFYVQWADDYLVSQMRFLPKAVVRWASDAFVGHEMLRVSVNIFLSDILAISGLAYYFHSREQERQVNELEQQQLRLELEYLKSQMNPHFLFNTLNNIYSLAQERSEKAAVIVARLSELMRYVLYESDAEKVPLSSEVGFIENYMDIERVRFPDRIDLRFDWQGAGEGILIEPLLLIPFVENAFKHGVREETGRGFVEVVTILQDSELTFQVCNSKSISPAGTRGGLGLRNVRKRLELLYPGKHQLALSDTADRYTVSLTLQLNVCSAV